METKIDSTQSLSERSTARSTKLCDVETCHEHSRSSRALSGEKARVSSGGGSNTTSVSMNEHNGIRLYIAMLSFCLCQALCGLDLTLLATAIPVITSDFHALRDVGWYATAFYISSCVTQPLAGKMYSLWPKKGTYILFVLILEAGSLISALSPSSIVLIIGRAVTGIGASGILAGGMTILSTIVAKSKRPVYIGILSSSYFLSTIIGPVVGGAFTQYVSWRWCFWINLPIGGLSAVLAFMILRLEPNPAERKPLSEKILQLDIPGFILLAGTMVMLLLAIQLGGTFLAWNSATIIGLLVGCIASLGLFIYWSIRKGASALIPPAILRQRSVMIGLLGGLVGTGGFVAVVYFIPIYFQAVKGADPIQSGVMYLPTVIANVTTSVLGGMMVKRVKLCNPFLLLGAALMAIASGLLTTLTISTPSQQWIGFQVMLGIGLSFLWNMPQTIIQTSLEPKLIPFGVVVLIFGTTASSAIFPTVAEKIFESRLASALTISAPGIDTATIVSVGAAHIRDVIPAGSLAGVLDAYNSALRDVFIVPTACSSIAFLLYCGLKWEFMKSG